MNNKMAINTYLSTIESKKQTKQTRRTDRIMETESFDGCQMGRVCGGRLRGINWDNCNSISNKI